MAVALEQHYVYVYKWNGTGFSLFQDMSCCSAWWINDLEFFSIGSNYYLATALISGVTSSSQPIYTSKIYKWDGTNFVEFQAILTNENAPSIGDSFATKWKHFVIGTDHYLSVAHADEVVGSKIYKWNGTDFSLFQSIPKGASWGGMEYYAIGTDSYLIFGNSPSKIYKWNGTSFAEFQSIPIIPTNSWIDDWKHFIIGTDHYLAMANFQDTSLNFNQNSKIYKLGIRIIGLSGSLAFGDVIVNKTKELTLKIQNTGNSTMTVNSITYPASFSGSWNGTIPAGGSQNVTVIFSPTDVKTYTGTITVNSDKTAGTETITISGNGSPDLCQFTDSNGSTQQGIDLVKANPGSYQLFTQAQLDQKIADAVSTATASMYTKAQLDQAVKTEQLKWDANGDGRIGLEDIIRMLQVLAGLRP